MYITTNDREYENYYIDNRVLARINSMAYQTQHTSFWHHADKMSVALIVMDRFTRRDVEIPSNLLLKGMYCTDV